MTKNDNVFKKEKKKSALYTFRIKKFIPLYIHFPTKQNITGFDNTCSCIQLRIYMTKQIVKCI